MPSRGRPHYASPACVSPLELLSPEQKRQLNDQDDHDHQLQHKSACLLKLIDHHRVKFFSGSKLVSNECLKVAYTDSGDAQFVEPRRKHVTNKFERGSRTLGEFSNFQDDRAQSRGRRTHPPSGKHSSAALDKAIDLAQLACEQFVVVPKLQKLGVGIFQDERSCFSALLSIEHERSIPADHC